MRYSALLPSGQHIIQARKTLNRDARNMMWVVTLREISESTVTSMYIYDIEALRDHLTFILQEMELEKTGS